jgi:acyl-CoA synthetase (AMP-forming)/AMP-acid ligase II
MKKLLLVGSLVVILNVRRSYGEHLGVEILDGKSGQSSAVINGEGWYATGDVAIVDDQGFVYFKDRKRDLIISGGLNIYPSEVERVLACHPGARGLCR